MEILQKILVGLTSLLMSLQSNVANLASIPADVPEQGVQSEVLGATSPLDPSRVLVVYKINDKDADGDGVPDSKQLAEYYALKRNVPQSNLLGVTISVTNTYYYVDQYLKFYNDIVLPIKNKLADLGPQNIDVIMISGTLPSTVRDSASNNRSLDNVLMALSLLTDNVSTIFSKYSNSYLEATPTFDNDKGSFDHSLYKVGGKELYMVTRLGSESTLKGIDQLDQGLYAEKFLYPKEGYYNGIAYLDTRYLVSGLPYTNEYLASSSAVRLGSYSSYANADMNIAYSKKFIGDSGFNLKWETSESEIGEADAKYTDGLPALTAPKAFGYGGWYNYMKYQNVFDWLPGSFAVDLNSGATFGKTALNRGASAALYVIGEPYLDGHQRPHTFYYYMLNGFSFAEASMLATPYLNWWVENAGDPLYTPMKPKTPVTDSRAPVVSAGYPKLVVSPTTGQATLSIQVDDSLEPEVVRAEVEYGTTISYGNIATSSYGYSRIPKVVMPWVIGQSYHYRITLTDPVGNKTVSQDYVYNADSPMDTTLPTVSLTPPVTTSVSGRTTLSATASDNVAVAGVQFKLDGNNLEAEDTASPYAVYWDTTKSSNGSHSITAVARDTSGNQKTSSEIVFTVNNQTTDTEAPSVPTNLSASVVSTSQINLSWTNSTDNVGVTGYKIYRNGTQIGTSVTNSYQSTGLSPATSYSYTVLAYDVAGNNSAQSSSVSATTQANPVIPPSTTFKVGQRVQATSNLNIRSSASISASLLGTQDSGALGTIISGGQSSDGYYWWNVNYDSGVDGWSVETYLSAYLTPDPAPTPTPAEITDKFIIGDRVKTTAKLKVRLDPTIKTGKSLCTQEKNVYGTIIGGPQVANGYTWWQVNYDSSCDGWSAQDWLVK